MSNKGAYGAVCSLGNIRCRIIPCSDWATTPFLENTPDSLGDIKRVKTQKNHCQEWDNDIDDMKKGHFVSHFLTKIVTDVVAKFCST